MVKNGFIAKTKTTLVVLLSLLIAGLISGTAFAAEAAKDNVLKEGVASYSEVKLVEFPNSTKKILVYTDDDSAANEWSAGRLYCSFSSDGNSFAVPKALKDDETWDMQPFVYVDGNVAVVTWTDANKGFDENTTTDAMVSSMGLSIAIVDSNGSVKSHSFMGGGLEDTFYFGSRVAKSGSKLLVTWVACTNSEDVGRTYRIEGLYYDPETDGFQSIDGSVDANGNPKPAVFVEDDKYIPSYSVAEINGSVAILFEEATDGTQFSDVLRNAVYGGLSPRGDEAVKTKQLKLVSAADGVARTVALANSNPSVVESDLSELAFYSSGTISKISGFSSGAEGFSTSKIADVSRTGSVRYEIISKDGSELYIAAYDPAQQDIRLYYRDGSSSGMTLLPLGMRGEDGIAFPTEPSIILSSSGRLASLWAKGPVGDRSNIALVYSEYEQQELQKADYGAVTEAINKATALNAEEYVDFSPVTNAVSAVVYGKSYAEQVEVDAYAAAINDAISALTLRGADYAAVDALVTKAQALDADLYKDFSPVSAAIGAIDRSKTIREQAEVDAMAKAIDDAMAALEYKDADYSKVDEAIAKAGALNKAEYKDFSTVELAVESVVRGKNITEQDSVDAMAKAIEDAIDALEKKAEDDDAGQVDIGKKSESEEPQASDEGSLTDADSQTGDSDTFMFLIALVFLSGASAVFSRIMGGRARRCKR